MNDRDRHYTLPPSEGLLLRPDDLVWLKVLIDSAVPRESDGPMHWEGVGRRVAEVKLGFRKPCNCVSVRAGYPYAAGCPVHDPEGL